MQLDEAAIRAVDNFMNAPVNNNRKSVQQQNRETIVVPDQPKTLKTKSTPLGKTQNSNGVTISKSYTMLCGYCGKRFTKVMIVELTDTTEDRALTVFDVQLYFNSVLSKFFCSYIYLVDHEYECPFCQNQVQIILHENLLIGDLQ